MKDTFITILDYIEDNLGDDPVLKWILAETPRRGIPEIQITGVQGRFLGLLAGLLGAQRILEVGTLSGYSGVCMARAMAPGGKLITLEVSEQHAMLAREAFARAGVQDRVQLYVGPALDTMARLELDQPLDMTFIDADKANNLNYFNWAYARTRPGGLVIVDNVFMNGRVITRPNNAFMRSIADFNAHVFAHYGEATTAVPFYKKDEDNLDGVLIVRVDGQAPTA